MREMAFLVIWTLLSRSGREKPRPLAQRDQVGTLEHGLLGRGMEHGASMEHQPLMDG